MVQRSSGPRGCASGLIGRRSGPYMRAMRTARPSIVIATKPQHSRRKKVQPALIGPRIVVATRSKLGLRMAVSAAADTVSPEAEAFFARMMRPPDHLGE